MSKIEWTDRTWNPVVGCLKVSEGCRNCYAEKMAWRLSKIPHTAHKYRRVVGKDGWTGKAERADSTFDLEGPLHWKKPQKIFVCSMGDLFHDDVWDRTIDAVIRVVGECPQHTFQILTKRPERARETVIHHLRTGADVLENIWLGTSVESGEYKERIVVLQNTPAAVRFVSFEPLLGPVGELDLTGIHQVIVGGESGPCARPMKREWVDEIFQQAKAQGVAFFFKQWGEYGADGQKVGRKKAGRTYKGQTWDEMPEGER